MNSRYSNKDNDSRGAWTSGDLLRKDVQHSGLYTITTPNGTKYDPPSGRSWRVPEYRLKEMVADNRIWFGENGGNVPRIKRFLSEVQDGMRPLTIWKHTEVGHNQEASQELRKQFDGDTYFDTPKSVRLLSRILHISSRENDIVLDFFAGSATTAHAVMKLNSEDGSNRKFIMVQLPETTDEKSEAYKAGYKTIAEISKERIRRAAAKIKEELEPQNTRNTQKKDEDLLNFGEADISVSSVSSVVKKIDLGFKVFKLDSTNIKPWEVDFDMTERTLEDFISNIKPARREEDVLYEILLKYGLDLTLPISEHTIAGQKVFDIGMGALIICLADAISLDVVEGMAKLKEELNPEIMRVVFKDSGFKDDVVKTNAVQILKQAGIVDVRSL